MARSTLIVLAILFTLVAFVAADVDFWRAHATHGRVHYHVNTLFTSFGIASKGEIDLDEESGGVVAIEPGAYLEIRQRRLTTRRRLEVRGDASGRPVYTYEVNSRRRPEAEAKRYLAANLDEILSSTTVGAEARARRLAAEGGAERVLREIDRLETNSLRRIYLTEAASAPGLDADLGARIVRTAGRVISSSSQLRKTLESSAASLSREWDLTAELARAAEAIGSSSERAAALEAIVRLRSVGADDVAALRDAVATISSTAEKGRLIRTLVELEPTPALIEGMLAATRTIDSSVERHRVLSDLVAVEALPAELFLEALDVAEGISSSAEKARFLDELAPILPVDPELERRHIEVASTIASSVETQRALTALLEHHDLPSAVCVDWVRAASEVSSSKVTGDLLVAATRRCAAAPGAWSAYLMAVEELSSSVEQRRSLMALLDGADLDATTRDEIAALAERAIGSNAERQKILERLGTPVTR